MPRIVTYCRSATSAPSVTLDDAERQLAELVAALPAHALAGAFRDLGASGAGRPQDRSGFRALLAAQAGEPAEILLLPALHHLTRDRAAVPALVADLGRRGLVIRTREDLASWPAPSSCDLLSTSLCSLGS